MIKTAKLIENGVLINGKTTLPDGNTGHIRNMYDKWLSDGNTPEPVGIKPDNSKLSEITHLELKVTPRRYREAILTGDNSFIEDIESQIQAIRDSM